MLKRFFSLVLVAMLLCLVAIPAAFAAGDVSFTLECSKPGYTFTVYKVANYTQSDSNPYGTSYTSLVSDVSSAILAGDMTNSTATSTLLAALDASNLTGATTVGTYNSTSDGATKTFSGQDKGIYYVKATNYPAGVESVTNSVFALPYYDGTNQTWVNTIPAINLASKVTDSDVDIVKTITNSTQNNVNYTDGSLGDTVNFKLVSDTAGTDDMYLNSYVVTDTMSKGLTFNSNSVVIKLTNATGSTTVKTLGSTEYSVSTTGGSGEATVITFTLTPATILATGSDFYDAEKVEITYSATINQYADTGKVGNPNTASNITYSNKNNVSATSAGNTVYVYTYSVQLTKEDQSNTALAGATFKIYDSTGTTELGTGTSVSGTGLVTFTSSGNPLKLGHGSYIIRETAAPSGYNRYTEDISVTINPTYTSTLTNGTYVSNEPNDSGTYDAGVVKNSKTVLPATGGIGDMWMYILAGVVALAAAGAFVVYRRKARASK